MEQNPVQAFINNLVDNEKVLAQMIVEGVNDEEITATKGFDAAQIATMKERLAQYEVKEKAETEEEKVNDHSATEETETDGVKEDGEGSADTAQQSDGTDADSAEKSVEQNEAAPATEEGAVVGDSAQTEGGEVANTEAATDAAPVEQGSGEANTEEGEKTA